MVVEMDASVDQIVSFIKGSWLMQMLLQLSPADDPVYQFLDRKRAEGKPYHVYMNAGGNKFLRRYYGKVRDYLATLDPPPPVELWSADEPTEVALQH